MTNFQYFINTYRNSDLLIDTNLLIVLLVGITDQTFLSKVKATRAYAVEDFLLLTELLKHFRIVTTPHILSEASNLCEKAETFYKQKIFQTFSQTAIDILEVQVPAITVTATPVFFKLGLTDSVIFKLAKEGLIILTDDFALHSYIIGNGATAANMNLFRTDYLI